MNESERFHDLITKESIRIQREIDTKKQEIIKAALDIHGLFVDFSKNYEGEFSPLLIVRNSNNRATEVYYNNTPLEHMKLVTFIPCDNPPQLSFVSGEMHKHKISFNYKIH